MKSFPFGDLRDNMKSQVSNHQGQPVVGGPRSAHRRVYQDILFANISVWH